MRKKGIQLNYAYITIFLVSCSMLMFEILLTRICALRLFFHFSFLVISNSLLGIGASGTMIAVLQETFARRKRYWVWMFSGFYIVSLVLTYIFLLTYPVEESINFSSIASILGFILFNMGAAVPFFFAGSVIGLLLTFHAEDVNRVYGFDLLGAGLGCLLCPFFLWQAGAGGCLVFIGLLAVAGFVASVPKERRKLAVVTGVIVGLLGIYLLPNLDKWFPVPCKTEVLVTDDVGIQFRDNIVHSQWSSASRIDLVEIAPEHRFVIGMGGNVRLPAPIPEEKYIMQDGSAGTYILNFSEHPEALEILKMSLYSTAFNLKDNPRVFIIGVGGGNDVWAAKANGAQYIRGIELNEPILDIHKGMMYRFSKDICDAPGIDLVFGEGRSALMREKEKYDVIQMSGIDTWTSLASGGYVLAENYLYTTEAIGIMYDKLNDNGIVAITRFAAAMETARLFSNIFESLKESAVSDLSKSVVSLGSGALRTILVKKGEFTPGELKKFEDFAARGGFDMVYHPLKPRRSFVDFFVRSRDKERIMREFPRNIWPTTDDQPYFFNFSKWSRAFSSSKYLYEVTAVSQGNPLFIFLQLLVSAFFALIFILLPTAAKFRKKIRRTHLGRFLIYFSGLGIGFIFIEIAMMQKLVLFLGHPLYSITVTLFSMLIFAALGSILSRRWFDVGTRRAWILPSMVAGLVLLFILFAPALFRSLIGLPSMMRILIGVLLLAPFSLLLGMPFAYGIRLVDHHNSTIIPWAWAVNGFMTVIGSILAVILSMNFGFNVVLVVSVLIYFTAFLALPAQKT